jgi:enamine deaminase RidA (YjgF/YER057c/UK114 family)
MVNPLQPEIPSAEQRIAALGISLPPAPQPLGAYAETVQSGNLLFLTGTLPVLQGKPQYVGTLGRDLSLEDGAQAARLSTINALAAARQHLGTLDRVTRILKTEVYLVTTEDLIPHLPRIADGASNLLLSIFGDHGLSARKVMGVASIPLHAPVMVELLLEIRT